MVIEPTPTQGWVTSVREAWMLPPFLKQLQKRQREQVLLEQLADCLDRLYDDPRHAGLNLETLNTNTARPVLSARIDRGNRLILTPLSASQVGLLYFDGHDEAYNWVRRQGGRLSTMLANSVRLHAALASLLGSVLCQRCAPRRIPKLRWPLRRNSVRCSTMASPVISPISTRSSADSPSCA